MEQHEDDFGAGRRKCVHVLDLAKRQRQVVNVAALLLLGRLTDDNDRVFRLAGVLFGGL